MSLRQQIEHHTQRYLDAKIDAAAFEAWFIPATWHIDVERDAELGPLVAHVTALLADYKDDEIDEARFRTLLDQSTSHSATRSAR